MCLNIEIITLFDIIVVDDADAGIDFGAVVGVAFRDKISTSLICLECRALSKLCRERHVHKSGSSELFKSNRHICKKDLNQWPLF